MAKRKPAAAIDSGWSRIVGHDKVAPASIVPNPQNYRLHGERQMGALGGAIDTVGYLRSVTINQRTGRLLDGHARVALAIARNEPLIDVEYVDVPEEHEATVIASFDPVAALAESDNNLLASLLDNAATDNDYLRGLFDDMQSLASAAILRDLGSTPVDDDTPDTTDSVGGSSTELATPPQQQYLQLNVPLTPDQDSVIRMAINHAKEHHGAESSGEALAKICAQWGAGQWAVSGTDHQSEAV